jgi:hypothetical protein
MQMSNFGAGALALRYNYLSYNCFVENFIIFSINGIRFHGGCTTHEQRKKLSSEKGHFSEERAQKTPSNAVAKSVSRRSLM